MAVQNAVYAHYYYIEIDIFILNSRMSLNNNSRKGLLLVVLEDKKASTEGNPVSYGLDLDRFPIVCLHCYCK